MDKDLKDTIRKIEEAKKKQERLEKTIIILSGILIIIVFTVIGINLYSGKGEKVSEPEINIVDEKAIEAPVKKEEQKVAKVNAEIKQEQEKKSKDIKKPQGKNS